MIEKVLSGTLIVLSILFFILGAIGIGATWYYDKPLTDEAIAQLTEVDDELEQAENALVAAQGELKQAMRMVESAEETLESFSEQREEALKFLGAVTGLLDDTITPSLETSKEKLAEVQENLADLRATVELFNKIPFVDIELPDAGALDFFVEVTDSFEEEIDNVGEMAEEASTFLSDASYLLGGDLEETKGNIENLMVVVNDYEEKISEWRIEIEKLIENLPDWAARLSALISIFLIWFVFSQLGLFLHGLTSWHEEKNLSEESLAQENSSTKAA
ncbi:MAG: hypothetical protein HN392_04750 [Anaerolineae bacterium]|nr:hypothetical protein [Anaerolineae bacterium]MBT7073662.1 hypothetical protein [Anaerolineae bacterium]MBT7781767.1 hypothetical protein [Anaerolineae bacterium]